MCTLGTDTVVNPRLNLLSSCHYLWNYLVYIYPGQTNCFRSKTHFELLVSPYGITLEMCTMDSETVVDPRYTLFSPGLSLWYYLGDVYPGYTI